MLRKTTHLGALVIPCGYHFLQLSQFQMLSIMVPITLAVVLADISRLRGWSLWGNTLSRLFSGMIRPKEQDGDFTGAFYILITVCLTVLMFEKYIAIAAISFIITGDTFAAIIGRRYGRHRLFQTKSWEGSLSCLAATLVTVMFLPGIALEVALSGAVIAAVVEALPLGIDDNVSVPIVSGLFMTLLCRLL